MSAEQAERLLSVVAVVVGWVVEWSSQGQRWTARAKDLLQVGRGGAASCRSMVESCPVIHPFSAAQASSDLNHPSSFPRIYHTGLEPAGGLAAGGGPGLLLGPQHGPSHHGGKGR